jgi:hypothetical protein
MIPRIPDMKSNARSTALVALSALAIGALGEVAMRAPAYAQPVASSIDPAAISALDRSADYLRSRPAFQVRINTSVAVTAGPDKGKDSIAFSTQYTVQKPDKLFAELKSGGEALRFYSKGGVMTVYSTKKNQYAKVNVPPTNKETMDMLYRDYNFRTPVQRLFFFNSKVKAPERLTAARRVGPQDVNGTPCVSYTFSQAGLEWQVWLRQGEHPVPMKLVIVDPKDPSRPQYTAFLDWTMFPAVLGNEFVLTPPPGAKEVKSLG